MNSLQILFELYPEANWNFGNLSENPNISWNMVKNNLFSNNFFDEWEFSDLSQNPAISVENIQEYHYLPWDWQSMSSHPNLTWEFVEKNINKEWDIKELSANPVITYNIVKKYPDIEWSWEGLLLNPNITFDIIKSDWRFWGNIDLDMNNICDFVKNNYNREFWRYLYRNPNISWKDIECYIKEFNNIPEDSPKNGIHKCINKIILLSAPILTMDKLQYLNMDEFFIFDHSSELLINPNLTYDIASKYNITNITWNRLARTLPLNSEILKRHKDMFNDNDEHLYQLSNNKSLTIDILLDNLDICWDWYWLSQHHNITYENIISSSTLNWDMKGISANPNITWKTICKNPDKEWDFFHISRNKFLKEPNVYKRNNQKKLFKRILQNDKRIYNHIIDNILKFN